MPLETATERRIDRAHSAADIALWVKGAKQGQFKGGTPKKERKDAFDIWEAYHDIVSPRDVQTGHAYGKRQHHPLVVVGEVTGGTAQLYTAIFTNETLSSVKLDFYRSNAATAHQEVYYTIELKNATLAELENLQDETGRPNFRAQFTYQEITLTWKDGNLTATDTWLGTT